MELLEETKEDRTRRLNREKAAAWRAKNPEKSKAACKKYGDKNRDARRAQTLEIMKRQRRENPEAHKATQRHYYENNKEKFFARNRELYKRNPKKRCEQIADYRARNPGKHEACLKAWAKNNPEKRKETERKSRQRPEAKARHCERVAHRNAQKKRATPSWANEAAILEIYKYAAHMTESTGEPHEVDHRVPLISDIVCGLHCEANLFVLTASENRRKRNFFWDGMP